MQIVPAIIVIAILFATLNIRRWTDSKDEDSGAE